MSRWKMASFYSLLLVIMIVSVYGCKRKEEKTVSKEEYISTEKITEERPSKEEAKEGADVLKVTASYPPEGSVLSLEGTAPREININQPYEYSVTVTNLTKMPVRNVEVIQHLPQKFQIKSSDPTMREGVKNGTVKWSLGDLEPEETKVIRITGISGEPGEIPICADVTYHLPQLCLMTNVVQPKLAVTMHAPSEALVCDAIPVTIVASNTGSGAVKNVEIKEALPAGLKTSEGDTKVVENIGTLNPGETREISLTVRPDKTGKFTGAAKAVGEGGLSAESAPTTIVVRQPVLTIEKSGPEKRYINRKATYDITVENTGDGAAASTIIENPIPVNMSYESASEGATVANGAIKWNLGTLQPQDSRKVSMTLITKSLGSAKSITTAKANCAEPVSAAVTTEVLGVPALLLEAVDTKDPVVIGNTTSYTISVTNQGSEVSTNIKVDCVLADAMQYVSSTGPTKGAIDGKTVRFDPLETLDPEAKASWQVVVKAVDQGDTRFKVSMIEDCLDKPVEETESTNFYK